MDQATAARHRLEAVEVRTRSLCRVATPRCRPGSGGTDRRQPTWPLATRKQPRAHHRAANDLSQITRPSFHRRTAACLIRRTAGYGPVCPVVWEGRSRKISPYPDCATGGRRLSVIGRFPDRGTVALARRHVGAVAFVSFTLRLSKNAIRYLYIAPCC